MHHDTKEQGSVGQSATSGDGKHHTPSISITLCLADFSKQLEHHTHIWLHLPRQRTARRLHSLAWCVRVTACWRSGMANPRFGRTYQQHHTIGLGRQAKSSEQIAFGKQHDTSSTATPWQFS